MVPERRNDSRTERLRRICGSHIFNLLLGIGDNHANRCYGDTGTDFGWSARLFTGAGCFLSGGLFNRTEDLVG